jgi:hypothetical protein
MVTLLGVAHTTIAVSECPLCQRPPAPGKGKTCIGCGAHVAERAFAALVHEMLRGNSTNLPIAELMCAAHRLTTRERNFLLKFGGCLQQSLPQSMSKPGDIEDQNSWRRMAALSAMQSESVDIFYSAPGCLDFIDEFGAALESITRVLKPAGAAVVSLSSGRLVNGGQVPTRKVHLDRIRHARPLDAQLWSIEVGREWIFGKWREFGLSPCSVFVHDEASATKREFLIGQKTPARCRSGAP